MTIKVLIDIFSMLEYKKFIQERDKEYLYNITDCYHVIENFILCDEIILDKNGVQLQDLSSLCNQHEDVIGYIDSTHLETPLYKTLSGHNLNYMIHDVIKQNWGIEYRLNRGRYSNKQPLTHEQAEELISRTFGYIELANNHEIYFSPHPLRNILSQTTSSINNIEANKIIAYCDNLFVESEVGKYTNIDIHVPPVVEHVISFSRKNKISIPESITAIRNTKNATSFRKYCAILENEIKNLTPRKKISHYQSLLKDIHLNVESWVNDINENVRYRKRKIKLSKLPIIGKLLESAGMHEPEVKDPILKTSTSLFINDIYRPSSRFNVRNMSRRNQLM